MLEDNTLFFRLLQEPLYRKNIFSLERKELINKSSEIKLFGKKRRDIEKQAVCFLRENIIPETIKFGYMVFDSAKFLNEEDEIREAVNQYLFTNFENVLQSYYVARGSVAYFNFVLVRNLQ